jgi:hypothetical protein
MYLTKDINLEYIRNPYNAIRVQIAQLKIY